MHKTSMMNMERFVNNYLAKEQMLRIADIGSMDIHGAYRPLFSAPAWEYVGVDIETGPNVDVVLKDVYNWHEFVDGYFNVVISGQAFEHIEYFWLTMQEIGRILAPGGLCCIIAPSTGKEHRYPVDCYRFYPDGMRALAKYAGLTPLEVFAQWGPDGDKNWHDCVLIARKNGQLKSGLKI